MATGYRLSDGRDFDAVFAAGSGNPTTGFKAQNGQDLANLFMIGNSGIYTGFKNRAGVDLGLLFGTNTQRILVDRKTYSDSWDCMDREGTTLHCDKSGLGDFPSVRDIPIVGQNFAISLYSGWTRTYCMWNASGCGVENKGELSTSLSAEPSYPFSVKLYFNGQLFTGSIERAVSSWVWSDEGTLRNLIVNNEGQYVSVYATV